MISRAQPCLSLAEPSLSAVDKALLASHLCRVAWARVLVSCYTSAYVASLYMVMGGVQLGLLQRQQHTADDLDEAVLADAQATLKTLWLARTWCSALKEKRLFPRPAVAVFDLISAPVFVSLPPHLKGHGAQRQRVAQGHDSYRRV